MFITAPPRDVPKKSHEGYYGFHKNLQGTAKIKIYINSHLLPGIGTGRFNNSKSNVKTEKDSGNT